MSKYLKRDEILNFDDLKMEEISVPQWGGTVLVKAMTGKERDRFEMSLVDTKEGSTGTENIRAKLVAQTIIDPDTKELMFTVADIEALGQKSAAALDKIFVIAQKLSKISDEDVKDLEKN